MVYIPGNKPGCSPGLHPLSIYNITIVFAVWINVRILGTTPTIKTKFNGCLINNNLHHIKLI